MTKTAKVTVLKRAVFPEIVEEYAPREMGPCNIFEDGQEFIIQSDVVAPEGFCAWAYADIQKYLMLVKHEAKVGLKHEGTAIACCSDGFRPVVFKIERMD